MGCDIHTVLEKYWEMGDRWVGVQAGVCTERNYTRFGMLAGVRNDGPEAKGLPEDASDMAVMYYSNNDDLHSHSYNYLEEFLQIVCKTDEMPADKNKAYMQAMLDGKFYEWAMREYLGLWDDDISQYRVVYCFDN
jgi:hypothetical protein